MRRMTNTFAGTILLLYAAHGGFAADTAPGPDYQQLKAMEWMIGDWHAEWVVPSGGEWALDGYPAGATVHSTCSYSWMQNKNYIRLRFRDEIDGAFADRWEYDSNVRAAVLSSFRCRRSVTCSVGDSMPGCTPYWHGVWCRLGYPPITAGAHPSGDIGAAVTIEVTYAHVNPFHTCGPAAPLGVCERCSIGSGHPPLAAAGHLAGNVIEPVAIEIADHHILPSDVRTPRCPVLSVEAAFAGR
jgi:hypothetical protein